MTTAEEIAQHIEEICGNYTVIKEEENKFEIINNDTRKGYIVTVEEKE